MTYLVEHLNVHVDSFIAKILHHNDSSIRLFEDKLDFKVLERVEVFGEIHLIRDNDEALRDEMEQVKAAWSVNNWRHSSSLTSDRFLSAGSLPPLVDDNVADIF